MEDDIEKPSPAIIYRDFLEWQDNEELDLEKLGSYLRQYEQLLEICREVLLDERTVEEIRSSQGQGVYQRRTRGFPEGGFCSLETSARTLHPYILLGTTKESLNRSLIGWNDVPDVPQLRDLYESILLEYESVRETIEEYAKTL